MGEAAPAMRFALNVAANVPGAGLGCRRTDASALAGVNRRCSDWWLALAGRDAGASSEWVWDSLSSSVRLSCSCGAAALEASEERREVVVESVDESVCNGLLQCGHNQRKD